MKRYSAAGRAFPGRSSAAAALLLLAVPSLDAGRPIEGIQDNSFFVEEAYNQEPGVVQHIFLGAGSVDQFRAADDRELSLAFTQEWPLFSQAHQFSVTLEYGHVENAGSSANGIGDTQISYRYQALMESDRLPAFAPRLSLNLPSGDDDRGLGDGRVGYQLNLPFSKVIADRWSVHFNASATWTPAQRGQDLVSYQIGGSAIYALSSEFHLMLEAVGSWDEEHAERVGTLREFSAIIAPGFRYAFNLSDDSQVVLGAATPIGLTGSAPDYGVLLYISIEHGFLSGERR